ncbi:hypothetical protein EX30DRAFT_373931, partial [Ascodesmis nigricans]
MAPTRTPARATTTPPHRLASLFDHSYGPTGLPSIAAARKKATEELRLWSSIRAAEIASLDQQNASTTFTDTVQPQTNNP